MKIENSFTVDAPVDEAWALLTNIPEIAPCLPGAKLSGEEDGVYKGAVKVKVGPVTAEYRGTAEFVEKDDVAHKAVINGKGRDSRGAGNAQALITAEMQQVGDQTQVDIVTDLKISGKVAQFGRGVMQDVSEKLLGQFAECLAGKLGDNASAEEIAAAGAAAAGDASAATEPPEVPPAAAAAPIDSSSASAASEEEDDVLDLLDVAGEAAFKRFAPALGALTALIIFLLWRSRKKR
ncbi:MAG: membrane oxidoreductase [Acidimicrobiales bacterium]|nr:MAG: membrane oxidoreductase [Acidimicrobiales bacterium]